MKLFFTTITAVAITATSAFAMITPEDRAMNADQRINGIEAVGEKVTLSPLFKLQGRGAISEGETITVTLVETQAYAESIEIGRQ